MSMPHPSPQLSYHTAAKAAGLGTITGNAIDVDHVVMGTNGQVYPIYKDSHSEKAGPGTGLGPGWGWLPPGLYRTTESCSLPSVVSDTISLVSVSKTSHLEGRGGKAGVNIPVLGSTLTSWRDEHPQKSCGVDRKVPTAVLCREVRRG